MLQHLQKHRINRQLRQQSTHAMTMIELLVVITIIMVLTAVMIPTIRYQYRNRALREAERQLIAFIGSAQARALQLGRPVGIWIDRFSDSETPTGANYTGANYAVATNYAVAIYLAEIPRPYTGETRNERVKVSLNQTTNTIELTFNNNTLAGDRLIKRGDFFKIQFAHHGPYYAAEKKLDGVYILLPDLKFGRIPTADFSTGVPYKIQRKPKKSFLPPLRLPAGAVIDLSVSGMRAGGSEFSTTNATGTKPVIIMFQSDGSIDRVRYNGPGERPLGWVHLLIGRQNQVWPTSQFLDAETEKGNIMDMRNRWVSINHRTGSITSEQIDSVSRQTSSSDSVAQKLTAARGLVRSGTGSGGN
jgi:type II secretory pathway pseudopilin PulG